MTKNSNLKKRVRSRAAKTGETYTAALRHIRAQGPSPDGSLSAQAGANKSADYAAKIVRLAVAQSPVCGDPRDVAALQANCDILVSLMGQAKTAGAELIQFPEGALCSPNKRILSSTGATDIGPADWELCRWDIIHETLSTVQEQARLMGLWVVIGAPHKLPGSQRPYNSLYIITNEGDILARYDERMLSNTKASFMYTPGTSSMTFDVNGVRFGCALGMEAHYPEIFAEYERYETDCVLFSSLGGAPSDQTFAAEMLGHAAINTFWTSLSIHTQPEDVAPGGIASPKGLWAANCKGKRHPSIAVHDVSRNAGSVERNWRRQARQHAMAIGVHIGPNDLGTPSSPDSDTLEDKHSGRP